MPDALAVEPVPLVTGSDGVIVVESTRVPLDTIIASFDGGATPEEIAQQYPAVPLGVAYQVIGYYLRHRAQLDSYLAQRAEQRAKLRSVNESQWPSAGIRERLLARRK